MLLDEFFLEDFELLLALAVFLVEYGSELLVLHLQLFELPDPISLLGGLLFEVGLPLLPLRAPLPLLSLGLLGLLLVLLLLLQLLLRHSILLLHLLRQAVDLLLQLHDHAVLFCFQMAYFRDILLGDLRGTPRHLASILVHLVKLALK